LTTVILSDGLEEIEANAFYGCRSLKRIEIPPAIKAIKGGAFHCCPGLTAAILGDGLKEIDANAFRDCTFLERIGIPPVIKAIEEGAFYGCSGLMTGMFSAMDWRRF
jgi:hypothetical protein